MLTVSRRTLLRSAAGAIAAGSLLKSPAVLAQAVPLKLKFGNDLPVTHSVNVRLKEAIEAITAETSGKVTINLFPNNQLGSDTDMMTQLRSGALELATMPGTVMSTLTLDKSTGAEYPASSEGKGHTFESRRVRQQNQALLHFLIEASLGGVSAG